MKIFLTFLILLIGYTCNAQFNLGKHREFILGKERDDIKKLMMLTDTLIAFESKNLNCIYYYSFDKNSICFRVFVQPTKDKIWWLNSQREAVKKHAEFLYGVNWIDFESQKAKDKIILYQITKDSKNDPLLTAELFAKDDPVILEMLSPSTAQIDLSLLFLGKHKQYIIGKGEEIGGKVYYPKDTLVAFFTQNPPAIYRYGFDKKDNCDFMGIEPTKDKEYWLGQIKKLLDKQAEQINEITWIDFSTYKNSGKVVLYGLHRENGNLDGFTAILLNIEDSSIQNFLKQRAKTRGYME